MNQASSKARTFGGPAPPVSKKCQCLRLSEGRLRTIWSGRIVHIDYRSYQDRIDNDGRVARASQAKWVEVVMTLRRIGKGKRKLASCRSGSLKATSYPKGNSAATSGVGG